MLLSVRESAGLLAAAGLSFEQSRALLRTGVAGPGLRVGTSLGYDADAIAALALRPEVETAALRGETPNGLFVARLGRDVAIDLEDPWAEVADRLGDQPAMPELTRALLAARISAYRRLPWVATTSGFVVFGADATGVGAVPQVGSTRFVLEPPGPWWRALEGRRLSTRRGRPGLLLLPAQLRHATLGSGQTSES